MSDLCQLTHFLCTKASWEKIFYFSIDPIMQLVLEHLIFCNDRNIGVRFDRRMSNCKSIFFLRH